ncbi:MAG: efflux RND transporter periplasmic adaptor subunit [Candidatus Syntrophosphaera sp.]|nr:efflux RND transporter periplasmic adaptor subunit [Candidatus Syntrophosphaera sp.]
MKKIIWLVVIILAILIGWRVIARIREKSPSGAGNRGQQAVPVQTAPVQSMTVRDIGQFSGSLKPISGFTIAPKVAGRLERLMVNIGDRVTRGQLVAELDDDVYQQQLEQARANLAVATAQVEQARLAWKAAEANWEAVKTLFEQNYSSQAVMDQTDAEKAAARARYDIVQAEVQRAESLVRTAEIQLSNTRITAAWNGGGNTRVVGERFVDEGNLLTPNVPILTLLDNSTVTAQIDVIERDYARIRIGQPVSVQTDAFPEREFSGRLARLAPVLQDVSRQARAEIDIPNSWGLLKPGMFVRVQIEYAKHDNVPVVPKAAIVQRDRLSGVFVVDPEAQTASFIPITIGITDGDFTEVVEPRISGEVIVLGQDQLQDGAKIKLPDQAGEAKKGKAAGKP